MIFKKRTNGTIDKFIDNEFVGNFHPNDDTNPLSIELDNWLSDGNILEYSNLESLEVAKTIKKAEINALRDTRMAKDIPHKVNGIDHLFQRNIASNLAWINYLESSSEVAVSNWVTANNSIIDISQSDLISICAHIRDRDMQAVVQARRSKDLLETLTTIEEVQAFDINQVFEI